DCRSAARGEYLRISLWPADVTSIGSKRCQYSPPETCIVFALLFARASHSRKAGSQHTLRLLEYFGSAWAAKISLSTHVEWSNAEDRSSETTAMQSFARLRGRMYRRLMYEPFGPLNSLHTLSLLPAPIKGTRLFKSALG